MDGDSFNTNDLSLVVDFPDVAAVAPGKFTHEDIVQDCGEGGSDNLPKAGFTVLPSRFCEGCIDYHFVLGCVLSCGGCQVDSEYTFEIASVDYDDAGTPISLAGMMEGRYQVPVANLDMAYRIRFSVEGDAFDFLRPD
jgi:hypothetical protein